MPHQRRSHIIICDNPYCQASLWVLVGKEPAQCGTCRETPARWRIALPNELTKSDRRFLRMNRIAAEDERQKI